MVTTAGCAPLLLVQVLDQSNSCDLRMIMKPSSCWCMYCCAQPMHCRVDHRFMCCWMLLLTVHMLLPHACLVAVVTPASPGDSAPSSGAAAAPSTVMLAPVSFSGYSSAIVVGRSSQSAAPTYQHSNGSSNSDTSPASKEGAQSQPRHVLHATSLSYL